MSKIPTQEANLVVQTSLVVALLGALSRDRSLVNSKLYKDLPLDPPIREGIDQVGLDNQGLALMVLYAMLVVPRELLIDRYKSEFDRINTWLETSLTDTRTTYLKTPPDYLRHIRNAVAHADVSFVPNSTVKFEDEDKRNGFRFETTLPLSLLGAFVEKLQVIHTRYVQDWHADA